MSSTDSLGFDDRNSSNVSDVSEDSYTDVSLFGFRDIERSDDNHNLFTTPDLTTAVQNTSLGSSGPTSFPLLQLPSELRLHIYETLIAAGNLEIMRTSKLVHKEAANLLKKNGILRMNFGHVNRTSSASFPLTGRISLTGTLTIHAISTIQHVNLHFNLGAYDSYRWSGPLDIYTNLIMSFAGNGIARQSCTVVLDLGLRNLFPGKLSFERETSLQALTALTGFKTFVFKIFREKDYDHEDWCVRTFGHVPFQYEDSTRHRTLLENYDTVRQVMEITLGPGILNKSVESHCLEFHPSEFKTEDNNGTESGL